MARLRSLIENLTRRRRRDEELDSEVRGYAEMLAEENMRKGMKPEEARRAARLELGGVEQVKEQVREARAGAWLDSLLQDLRYGMRTLRRSPGFAAVTILTLALGIGATTGIFSVIDAVLLRSLPYGDPNGLVMVWEKNSQDVNPHNTVAPPDFLDWQAQNHVFSGMAAIFDERDTMTGNGEPQEIVAQGVTGNFFDVLGVRPLIGNGFTKENTQRGHDNVVVLSYGFWQERFGGDPNIVGKTVVLDGQSQTVVGVMPARFDWFIKDGSLTNARPQMWYPFAFPERWAARKIGRFLTVVARLNSGVTAGAAQVEMSTIAARLERQYPDFNGHWGVNVVPLSDQLSGELRPALLILFGAVVFVLLIACANVSSLLLARAAAREREMAIRTAIGAGRWRIGRQLLTESGLLALVGGGIGIALAIVGTNILLAASPANLLNLKSIPIDWRVLAFALAVTVLSALLFGVLPSYISARGGIAETLKESGRGTSSGERRRTARSAFVVAQTALAVVLLVGSGLLIRSFVRLIDVDPGFRADHLLTFKVTLPNKKYSTDPARLAFFQDLLARVRRLPGVSAVTMNSFPPLSGLGAATSVRILSQPPVPEADLPVAAVRVVGPDYFSTMSIPLRSGRTFNAAELAEERHVVVVNEAFVRQYLRGAEPIGQKLVISMRGPEIDDKYPSEVIGVVGNTHEMGPRTAPEPQVYWPHPELVYSGMTMLVRTSTDPMGLTSAIRTQLRELDPEEPMSEVATMDQLLSDSVSQSRFTALLLGLFAAMALVLAAVGTYGLIAYNAAQRTHEIGIRIALGARRWHVLRLVMGEGARLTLVGVTVGIVAALALTRLMKALLYGTSATDFLTFGSVVLLLTLVALAAGYIPARRATRVDPMVALRYE
ncbi:MAG TPA: ABC transporter permease [Candidatus Limnocylindrales bacterium]|nr:ABC transporter permease [Candidatus Limnocylindrales bacterium]